MPILEDAKHAAEQLTGIGRPQRTALTGLTWPRKAHGFRFKEDGKTPSHPRWPLLLYRSPVVLRGARPGGDFRGAVCGQWLEGFLA